MVNIYTVSDKALMGKEVNFLSCYLSESFFKNNIKILKQCIVSSTADFSFLKTQSEDKVINIFLVDKSNNNLNQTLCDISKSVIIENPYAKNAIFEYYNKISQPMEKECENEWKLPSHARVVINPNGITQGYMITTENASYFVLPNNYNHARQMFDDVVLDFILKDQKKKYKNFTFKTFGLPKESILEILNEELKNKDKISINLFEKPLEVDIVIKALEDNKFIDDMAQKIYLKLDKYVYSVEDIPIEKVVCELLKLNHIKLSFVEDITGGELCSRLIKQDIDVKNNIQESRVLLNTQTKSEFLNTNLTEEDSISANSVYNLAAKMISSSNSNIVVATIGSITKTNNVPSGLCFIAVGDKREIHVFKNIFKGNANEIIECVTMASYFYLLKKLKKNDFHFEQTTV